MQNLSDNDLDNLFRKAAENNTPEFDPAAWQQMEQRLEKAAKHGKTFSAIRYGILGLMMTGLLLTGGYIGYHLQYTPADTQASDLGTPADSHDHPGAQQQETPKTPGKASTSAAHTLDKSHKTLDSDKSASRSRSITTPSVVEAEHYRNIPSKVASREAPGIITQPTRQSDTTRSPGDDLTSSGYASLPNSFSQQDTLALANDNIFPDTPAEAEADDTKNEKASDGKESVQRSFGIMIGGSPDFSSVGFREHTRAGSNYGVVVEYRINPNWSVATGAILSRKYYVASDIEYNGHTVARAKGDCRITDIPLTVYYRFTPHHRTTFFAGVGVSSYLMNREDYVFQSAGYYGPGHTYTHSVSGKNQEWFSVMNVSIGYQHPLTSRFSIRAEPFVKLPLRGIGEGKLSLNSAGAFISLYYSLHTP